MGRSQAVTETAFWYIASARSTITDGSAGAIGVPTRRFRYMSQWITPAPAARASPAMPSPPVAITTPGRAKRSRQNETALSVKSIQVGCRLRKTARERVGLRRSGAGQGRSDAERAGESDQPPVHGVNR